MCDTLVALGNSTKDGTVIFGKNSDRPSNEVQLITYSPRRKYSEGELVNCTYISIPQVKETFAVLLSQPFWMWGAEMGANENGVVIGNEAIYTLEPLRNSGLLGMDLLRLALERARDAMEALKVITSLLETYHQGGGCSLDDKSWIYHNSFLIADYKQAYVLETADDWWIAEKVKDVRSISNEISIRGKGDLHKKGIIQHAIEMGYCKDDDEFDFAVTFSGMSRFNKLSPYSRGGKTSLLLKKNKGDITPKLMMEFLREHEAGICMHGGFESTGSQVSMLDKKEKKHLHWFTGTTLPCLSVYKPYAFPVEKQHVHEPGPYNNVRDDWIWNKHARFVRKLLFSNKNAIMNYRKKIRNIEREITEKAIEHDFSSNGKEFSEKISELNQKAWSEVNNLVNE